ncbi:uncharacterized protein RCC_10462 [Ramularia collo-cygni]|uniref:Yeast cell wall synthesis Kre9/Knh1-like N-terminal domain-containing protein n=1 Tax=Ramularia collo-cygni TaxID=112498 RepID=A0A2D3VP02_9PEZI|nr:uncharacterized protein RCC_10462 [Ramularia collo-cygni]CZT24734.1 uncharacterized protein RCC_10462 [Ramularia collo-cygni]
MKGNPPNPWFLVAFLSLFLHRHQPIHSFSHSFASIAPYAHTASSDRTTAGMFTKALLIGALAALATAQSSVLSFTRVPSPITAGEPQALTYATNDTETPVTIRLRKGPSGNLDTIATLSSSVMGGQYIWTPSDSLTNGNDYALEISQNGQVNYFGPFQLQGASGTGSGSSSSSSSSSMSGSSSSAAMPSSYSTSSAEAMNSTMTTSSHMMMGTGNAMPHMNSTNATMTSATLSSTRTSPSKPTNTDDLSTGGSGTGSDAPANTGAAAMLGSSAIALTFGAAVAVLMG